MYGTGTERGAHNGESANNVSLEYSHEMILCFLTIDAASIQSSVLYGTPLIHLATKRRATAQVAITVTTIPPTPSDEFRIVSISGYATLRLIAQRPRNGGEDKNIEDRQFDSNLDREKEESSKDYEV